MTDPWGSEGCLTSLETVIEHQHGWFALYSFDNTFLTLVEEGNWSKLILMMKHLNSCSWMALRKLRVNQWLYSWTTLLHISFLFLKLHNFFLAAQENCNSLNLVFSMCILCTGKLVRNSLVSSMCILSTTPNNICMNKLYRKTGQEWSGVQHVYSPYQALIIPLMKTETAQKNWYKMKSGV